MIDQMKISNSRLFDIHEGKSAPVTAEELGGIKVASDGFSVSDLKVLNIPFRTKDDKSDFSSACQIRISANLDVQSLSYLSWDDDHLYLLAKVVDKNFFNGKSGTDIWDGDCLELWINDFQFGITAVGTKRESYNYFWTGKEDGRIQTTFQLDEDMAQQADVKMIGGSVQSPGWIVTAAIPWNLFPEGKPAEGKPFKLALGFDYADGKSTGRKGQIYFPKGWRHADKNTFQDAILTK
jgi:hypothetical protein